MIKRYEVDLQVILNCQDFTWVLTALSGSAGTLTKFGTSPEVLPCEHCLFRTWHMVRILLAAYIQATNYCSFDSGGEKKLFT